ncbi:helix-turn-helix domain-containing protein [Clostridium sp. Marseille-Q2269]|uniref:TrmB family transcriptional regulator n=1 Tax=Clostridium sp. Marseille-Q2269 TaxID=2942205 RepID=UPI002073EF34|nr:helix-turn-helix domain-containing protein [Clostridium sp. Marseille-Q2269]
MENLLSLLKKFGFTESETKVYIALLKNGPGTGYEISKNSSVPRSKVYNILEILMDKGCIVVSKKEKPINYAPIPVEEFIENIKHHTSAILDEVKVELENCNSKIDLDQMWYIRGYENIFSKCRNMIDNAKNDVYIQVWKEDLKEVETEIKMAEEELSKILIILYSMNQDYTSEIKNYYRHGFEKDKLEEIGGRWITLVVDSNEMVFGHIQSEKNAEVIWTKSASMVFLAKENITHDAYCLRLIESLGDTLKDKFGDNLEGVRNIFENLKIKL